MSQPTVCVVIPCFNHAQFLEECLTSLLEQTHSGWEAIVVDDASDDAELVRQIIATLADPRIRYLRHDTNKGLAASRNSGFRASSGEFILPVDGDDKLEPDCLERLWAVISNDPSIDCVYPDVRMFGRQDGVLTFHGPPAGKMLTRKEDTLPGAGALIRRGFWERIGGFDESHALRYGQEDFEFWIRAHKNGCRAIRVPEPLYLYRHTHTSMHTAALLHQDQISRHIYNRHKDIFDTPWEAKKFLSQSYAIASAAWQQKGVRKNSIALASKAFLISPSWGNYKFTLKSFLSPSQLRFFQRGEVRRRVPFLGYPLTGKARYNPFFIIGVARSGNTLLRRILTSHLDLYIPPETFVLGDCINKFKVYGRKMNWPDLVHFVLSQFEFHPEFHTFNVWLGPLANKLQTASPEQRNLAHILNSFFRYHGQHHGHSFVRWGDKTPLNSLDDDLARGERPKRIGAGLPDTLVRLKKVFPDAQFIHIYRDGCDVAYSHLRGGFYQELEEAAERWLHVIRQMRRFVRKYQDHAFEIRYEHLISDPENTIRSVCRFLEIEYQPTMLLPPENVNELGDIPEWFWHKQAGDKINPENSGKGRRYLSAKQREELQKIIGEELEFLGYPPCGPEN